MHAGGPYPWICQHVATSVPVHKATAARFRDMVQHVAYVFFGFPIFDSINPSPVYKPFMWLFSTYVRIVLIVENSPTEKCSIVFCDMQSGKEDGNTGKTKINKDSKSNTVEAHKVVSC